LGLGQHNFDFFYVIKPEAIDKTIETMALSFNWTPFEAEEFYLDDLDSFGLFYWHGAIERHNKRVNKKK
jgi:hypothetical protein